jgi:hypothetical protein
MEPHTEAHIAIINSPEMQELPADSPILASLVRHIEGELQAQQQRASALQAKPGLGGYKGPSGPSAPNMGDVNPAMAEAPAAGNAMGDAVNPQNQ